MKRITIALGLTMAAMTASSASELKLIAGGSLAPLFKEIGPQFEKASGHTLSIHFDSTPNIIKRINEGTPFDAVVVPADVFKDATAKNHLTEPTVNIARVGYGVIVRAGTAKPDLSTPDKFKAALLAASSVSSTPSSAAGAYIGRVYERLGIADQMKAKTRAEALPTAIAPAVAKGDAELGIFLTNVFNAPGIALAGPFPADLQQELIFPAAVAADAKEPAAARALVDFLKSPAAVIAIKAAGMTPG
jgi:molybdate transport system substrate-binding protein